MSTSSIMHPTPYTATAAVVAAFAAGAIALSLSGSPSTSVDPSVQNRPDTSRQFVWHPTTAGGRVQLGE